MVGISKSGGRSFCTVDGEGTGAPYCFKCVASSANANSQVGESPRFLVVCGDEVVGAGKEGMPFICIGDKDIACLRGRNVYTPDKGVWGGSGV